MGIVSSEVLVQSIKGERDDQIIEVVVVEEDQNIRYEIRLLSFGEGIGWYVQKNLPLDPIQARALAETLLRKTNSFAKEPIREEKIRGEGTVINFPKSRLLKT
jgi:hypothetical protein